MSLDCRGVTHVGCVRQCNEDNVFFEALDENTVLAIVADGMGGYHGGEIASRLCVDSFVEHVVEELSQETTEDNIALLLRGAASKANQAILEARGDDELLARMGTTLVAALVRDNDVTLIHAGDSRCYSLLPGQPLEQLTRDDTVLQEMIDDGLVKAADADRTPFKNVLSKAVGVEADVEFSVQQFVWQEGMQLLLCSDGLSNILNDELLQMHLSAEQSTETKIQALLNDALEAGARDNVSVIVVAESEASAESLRGEYHGYTGTTD